MEIVLDFLPELVTLVIAVAVAVARTTDNKLDDKIAGLASDNKSAITKTIRNLVRDEDRRKNRGDNNQ